jgi:hypothetical protein
MFQFVDNFNQNLCAWRENPSDNAIAVDMLKGTNCLDENDPLPASVFHVCDALLETSRGSMPLLSYHNVGKWLPNTIGHKHIP